MMPGAVDYAASYFRCKTPTPIQGTPTYKALKRLKAELRANASSIESDLGGGDHGCLGLVLSDAECATVSAIPFVAPAYPNALTIPANATQIQAFALKEEHEEAKRKYCECKNIENASQRHIQDSMERKYLEHFVDEDTELSHDDIPDILNYLFDDYGRVPSEEVKEQENEIRQMNFHPADPMIMLCNPIEKLQRLAQAAKMTHSENQLLNLGLTVARNTRDFERALETWEDKPAIEKTWNNFKTHFKEAQKRLKAIRGPTMQQAGCHHANVLANAMKEETKVNNEEVLSSLQTVITQPSTADETSTLTPTSTLEQKVNTTPADSVQMQMLQILQQIQQDLQRNHNSNDTNNNNDTNQARTHRKTPDNARRARGDTTKYCWTHGACSHGSADCKMKAPGHKDEATFENRLGGSNAHCTVCPE